MVTTVFLEMALITLLGSSVRYLLPDLPVDELRPQLNRLVLALFLPALIFKVIYAAHLGGEVWRVPLAALTGLVVTLIAGSVVYGFSGTPPRVQGALILAGAFGNVTYLGLPVLQGLFPTALLPITETVILYEMTITPLNLVAGAALAAYYGQSATFSLTASLLQVAKLPLLWAIAAALFANLNGLVVPGPLLDTLTLLASAVPSLMILSLGMALKPSTLRAARRGLVGVVPALLIKLVLSPLVVLGAAKLGALPAPFLQATILEAAMPSQLITFLTADRYGLDTEQLAVCVLLDTTLSFFTVPLLYSLLLSGS